jgi:hypothetical protein
VRATDVVVPSVAVLITPDTLEPLVYVGWLSVIDGETVPPLAVTWVTQAVRRSCADKRAAADAPPISLEELAWVTALADIIGATTKQTMVTTSAVLLTVRAIATCQCIDHHHTTTA